MKNKTLVKGDLRLPEQVLNWSSVPANSQKIFLQFEINSYSNGVKKFGLVAYPAVKSGKSWKIGKKIILQDRKSGKSKTLALPITLGNLEMDCRSFKKKLKKNSKLIFTPALYSRNPHAGYLITDDSSLLNATANPSPPASPFS